MAIAADMNGGAGEEDEEDEDEIQIDHEQIEQHAQEQQMVGQGPDHDVSEQEAEGMYQQMIAN